ncbi:hypothetical protein AMJ40_06720 [candidate division TA06 bacterium DG_26]|uniref:Fis family transcriptional regulator n=1 Tax=candidate division TA06 bacterium DG_26 TaxID=1703771 RepID=A0A0S7WFC8_UNCT6|nr:MAG: hypothetical protein AMJ40_06720 [candidate division TA06 bacterium DG_26]
MGLSVLLVDDEPNLLESLGDLLERKGHTVATARDGMEALKILQDARFHVVIVDLKMPRMTGMELLKRVRAEFPQTAVLILTAYGTVDSAVAALKMGATDYICKPFSPDGILKAVSNVTAQQRRLYGMFNGRVDSEKAEGTRLQQSQLLHEEFVGCSASTVKVRRLVEQVAPTDLNVLIRGDSGTGKELVARALHSLSGRSEYPFIKVNCAAIPAELLEAELFGYERGAFTSAYYTKPGLFELAHKGSIFLDEICELPVLLQSKLLQVLEQKEFMRLGGKRSITVDVRILAATNANPADALDSGRLRVDLFYRLNEINISLPPLSERREDIPLLVDHFVTKYSEKYGKSPMEFSDEMLQRMVGHDWPGNIRELENLVKKIIVLQDTTVISALTLREKAKALGQTESEKGKTLILKETSRRAARQAEIALIKQTLAITNWNRTRAAKRLGISYRSLLQKIKEYGITGSD